MTKVGCVMYKTYGSEDMRFCCFQHTCEWPIHYCIFVVVHRCRWVPTNTVPQQWDLPKYQWLICMPVSTGIQRNHMWERWEGQGDVSIYLWTSEYKFMGPTCGPPGSCRFQMGPMLAPWTLLLGIPYQQLYPSAGVHVLQQQLIHHVIHIRLHNNIQI